jgi:SAM-dependent methyltransferase
MLEVDRQEYVRRYEARLAEHGCSPQALGWGKHGRQEVRFGVLAEHALREPSSSVLDVGCGFADLYDYLRQRGWGGEYTGIDIVPGVLAVARERHPGLDLRLQAVTDPGLGTYDFVLASGVFNARLTAGDNSEHIERCLAAMCRHTRVLAGADFLTHDVAFQKPEAWHTDPAWAFQLSRQFSRRAQLRHDYMPFEFALFIFADDAVSARNVFQATEDQLGRPDNLPS